MMMSKLLLLRAKARAKARRVPRSSGRPERPGPLGSGAALLEMVEWEDLGRRVQDVCTVLADEQGSELQATPAVLVAHSRMLREILYLFRLGRLASGFESWPSNTAWETSPLWALGNALGSTKILLFAPSPSRKGAQA